MRAIPRAVVVPALVVVFAVAAGCGDDASGGSGGEGSSSGGGGKIALLLSESKTPRYENTDKPAFEAKVKALCPACEVIYSNANADMATQQNQADQALTNGAKVLVVNAVDAKAAQSIAQKAKAQNVPVIAYDRLMSGPIDYYVGNGDPRRYGEMQGQQLVKAIEENGGAKGGQVVMINGAQTSPEAIALKKGARAAIDAAGIKVGKDYDTPDWSPDKAQQEMEQAITALGRGNIVGVLSTNDGMAGGVAAALEGAGAKPPLVPITGLDAELAAVQRMLVGEQNSSLYRSFKALADQAAEIAVGIVKGSPPAITETVKNDTGATVKAPPFMDAVMVTKDTIKDTVVKDGVLDVQQICTPKYADACAEAGLTTG